MKRLNLELTIRLALIDTRGTGEAQGPSTGFRTMNSNIMSAISGEKEYDTVYPAGCDQDSTQGTPDVSLLDFKSFIVGPLHVI